MASLEKKPGSPYWHCCMKRKDGSRTKRSTKETGTTKAMRVCKLMQAEELK